ncbi:MAG: sigma-70 family RNA polymerase sigma factor [Solirubrobacterales bacterium]
MENNLYDLLIESTNNNEDALMKIIDKFMPLIKNYNRKLSYDGADSDLIIHLIKIVKKFVNKRHFDFTNDKLIVSYIAKSIKHEYIRLSKINCKITKNETLLNEDILSIPTDNNFENAILINELLNRLPKNQSSLLRQIYMDGYSETNLATKLNISRQAINKAKRKALDNLKKYIQI